VVADTTPSLTMQVFSTMPWYPTPVAEGNSMSVSNTLSIPDQPHLCLSMMLLSAFRSL
jgi:hypothetical protein